MVCLNRWPRNGLVPLASFPDNRLYGGVSSRIVSIRDGCLNLTTGSPRLDLAHWAATLRRLGVGDFRDDPCRRFVYLFRVCREMPTPFVDIHCHLLPGIDDGATDEAVSLEMARMAVESGTQTIIATPHQLGSYGTNRGADIRRQVDLLQRRLTHANIPLTVLPGGDVRIEDGMMEKIASGEVLTLADRGRHVLLELPHELYFPLEPVLEQLRRRGLVGILSHPERNMGLLRQPTITASLVEAGCLMQVTAGSLVGAMGPAPQRMAEWMLSENLVHFVATDAHGIRSRRPRMKRAFERIWELAGKSIATQLCATNPAAVATGQPVAPFVRSKESGGWRRVLKQVTRPFRPADGRADTPRRRAA